MYVIDSEDFKNARITILLIISNILFYVGLTYISQDINLFYLLAQQNEKVIEQYEIWRLFTSMFLHSSWIHLGGNMLSLFLFGATVEKYFKNYEYIIIYFAAGFIGNLFSLILYPPYVTSVGASGAIFGLIGAAFILILKDNERTLLGLAAFYLVYYIVMSFQPRVNTWAHIFGLLGGILIGALFHWKKHRGHKLKPRYE